MSKSISYSFPTIENNFHIMLYQNNNDRAKTSKLLDHLRRNICGLEPALQVLLRNRVLDCSHLSLTVHSVFLQFVQDKIEELQLEFGNRDQELDEQWELTQEKLSNSLYKTFFVDINIKTILLEFGNVLTEKSTLYSIKNDFFY